MEKLNFSTNWNNKLYCDVFSTIRLENPKYKVGKQFIVSLKDESVKRVELIRVAPFKFYQLTDSIAFLDTGYDRSKTLDIIAEMYKPTALADLKLVHIICETKEIIKNSFQSTFNF